MVVELPLCRWLINKVNLSPDSIRITKQVFFSSKLTSNFLTLSFFYLSYIFKNDTPKIIDTALTRLYSFKIFNDLRKNRVLKYCEMQTTKILNEKNLLRLRKFCISAFTAVAIIDTTRNGTFPKSGYRYKCLFFFSNRKKKKNKANMSADIDIT